MTPCYEYVNRRPSVLIFVPWDNEHLLGGLKRGVVHMFLPPSHPSDSSVHVSGLDRYVTYVEGKSLDVFVRFSAKGLKGRRGRSRRFLVTVVESLKLVKSDLLDAERARHPDHLRHLPIHHTSCIPHVDVPERAAIQTSFSNFSPRPSTGTCQFIHHGSDRNPIYKHINNLARKARGRERTGDGKK